MEGYIKRSFILLLVISTALCENCVSYDFETNFEDSFIRDTLICNVMVGWNLRSYNESNVESPHPDSSSFISPNHDLSCVASFFFDMEPKGVVEALVYMESVLQSDVLTIMVNDINPPGGFINVHGISTLVPSATQEDGWHVVRVDILGGSKFDGYITFIAAASPGSTVLVDSFRYIPPLYEDDCYTYDENFVPPTRPPQIIPDPADCVTYDFEDNFEYDFNSYREHCIGFSEWTLHEYASVPVDRPISDSHHFISPHDHISCISSFPFNAASGGTIEVNVYMESRSDEDQIAILTNKVTNTKNDAVTGSIVHTPLHTNYVDGWQVLRIELSGDSSHYGYVSFLGVASADSIVLIDSFRYIPPKLAYEECKIYNEELFLTTTPVPTTTLTPTGLECVSFNFESSFGDSFYTNNPICRDYSAWQLGNYYSLPIESIDPESHTFISPTTSSSCTSSFVFEMKPGGLIEVNVFMKSISSLDYVMVLVKKVIPNGIDTLAGFNIYYAGNMNFIEGWNILKVSVRDFSAFNGYITLIGSMSEDSIVLIDSFRYIPPNSEEPCKIY